MKMKFIGLILAGLMVIGGSAQAAVLSLDLTGSSAEVLPLNFNPTGFPGGVTPGVTPITVYPGPVLAAGGIGGLSLDVASALKFEFLGSEAGFTDTFTFDGAVFSNVTSVGSSATVGALAGVIPFIFTTLGKSATNGGPIDAGVSIAFADLGDGSFLALFNDGGGQDFDYDDLAVRVSVSAVPLPAAAWLLISAILGLVSFSRIRRSGMQAA
jgi:hypothetical protein